MTGLASGAAAVEAGEYHTCALTVAGGVQCWGLNDSGQLGDGTNTNSLTPVSVSGLAIGVVAITGGLGHNCALTSGGGVLCWGLNGDGQLGDGTATDRWTPVAVSGMGSGVAAVAGGYFHSCALTSGGALRCWGGNSVGQIGDGTTTQRLTAVAVSGLSGGAVAVTAGSDHTCGLTGGGATQCWGWNASGQLGNGTTTNQWTPVTVIGLAGGGPTVAGGEYHSCAVTSTGAAQCWGRNTNGQLGDGTTTSRLMPAPVSGLGSGVAAVVTGAAHSCALTSAGAVLCWGDNFTGQLGDGTTTDRLTPVVVSGLTSGAVALAAGTLHTCAVTSVGGVVCWG